VFDLSEKKSFYSITFDEFFLNTDKEIKVIEDKNYLVTNEKIRNFLKSQNKFSDFESILKRKNEYSLKISKTLKKQRYKLINKGDFEKVSQKRFKSSDLAIPFFLKKNFPSENIFKNYQKDGIDWLSEKKGRILADDMGLGKTLQAVVASANKIIKKQIGTVIIACPSSLVFNWCNELNNWAPFFCVSALIDTGKHKNDIWEKIFGFNHFVVTNYEQIRDIPSILFKEEIGLIIADEAHKLRKASSQNHNSFRKLKYDNFWALSGTPIEKNTNDACHILKLVDQKRNLSSDLKLSEVSLRSTLRKYTLRRIKKDVLLELPENFEIETKIDLSEAQKKSYIECLKQKNKLDTNYLEIYNQLRKICDFDPKTKKSSKLEYILEVLEKIYAKEEQCVVFSFWLDPLRLLKKEIDIIYGKDAAILYSGELDKSEREKVLNNFKSTNSFVLLCSGKVGGEGINLTNANHTIFFNRWWNPSNNSQAQDRIHRLGQEKESFTHIPITMNTIEDKISEILRNKKEITKTVIEKIVRTNIEYG